jgi:CelD/BcsL family acetyltransferase involved in cellulose biosynthesis
MIAADSINRMEAALSDLRFSLAPIGEIDDLASQWRALEERSNASFFQSWSWIGTWLTTLPAGITPLVARCENAGDLVALGIIVPSRSRPQFLRYSRRLFLNETGVADLDVLFIEHNGWLADHRHDEAITRFVVHSLAATRGLGDEIILGGVDERALAITTPRGYIRRIANSLPAFSLDLTGDGIADLARFGRNTRYQIRRARRDYGALGPITITVPRNAIEAQAFLGELKALHQFYWEGRGRPGAFTRPYFEQFHRHLIATCWERGEVELLRVRAGDRTVGLLYNFIHRGKVYAYQSGFDYALLPRGHPGLLCHWLAIERHRAGGQRVYDFLAGDNRLKRSLSSTTTQLHWVILKRTALSACRERWLAPVIVRLRSWAPRQDMPREVLCDD